MQPAPRGLVDERPALDGPSFRRLHAVSESIGVLVGGGGVGVGGGGDEGGCVGGGRWCGMVRGNGVNVGAVGGRGADEVAQIKPKFVVSLQASGVAPRAGLAAVTRVDPVAVVPLQGTASLVFSPSHLLFQTDT